METITVSHNGREFVFPASVDRDAIGEVLSNIPNPLTVDNWTEDAKANWNRLHTFLNEANPYPRNGHTDTKAYAQWQAIRALYEFDGSAYSTLRAETYHVESEQRKRASDAKKANMLEHARMGKKHVFDTDEIPHLWAYKATTDARNKQGNLYISGDTIWSYGSHFAIARHVTGTRKRAAVLLTTRKYGNTTGKHVNYVTRAIPKDIPVFNVSHPEWDQKNIIAEYRARVKQSIESIAEYRIQNKTRVARWQASEARIKEANAYFEFIGERSRLSMPKDIENLKEHLAETARQLEKQERERKAKEEAKRAKYYKEIREMLLPAWLRGERKATATRDGVTKEFELNNFVSQLPEAYLRVTAELSDRALSVETTQGARVPLEHVARVWPIIKRLYAKGEGYKRNGHTIHLGHYALDSIDAKTGVIVAGCHTFERSEIERFGRVIESLNVKVTDESAEIQS